MVPRPPLAKNVTVAVTLRVKVQVPVSPRWSESVPDTLYVPPESVPDVEISPEELTFRPPLDFVTTNSTEPVLP